MNGRPKGPVRIELHPTDRCNLSCRFCWRKGDHEIRSDMELSEDKLLKIVDQAADLGVKEWIISGGGEPLIRKDTTIKVLRRIKKHGMWGQLTTNGTLIDEKVAKSLVDMKWDQVQISIDGPKASIQNDIRQKDFSFKKSIEGAKLISNFKDKYNFDDPYLGFNIVINQMNHNKLGEMVELASQTGAQLAYFEPIYPGYNSEKRLKLNEEEKKDMRKHIKKAINIAEKENIDTNIDEYFDTYSIEKENFDERVKDINFEADSDFIESPCFQPWYLMGIKGSGLAGCCSTFETGEFIHDKSLSEVWFGDKFNEIRNNMANKNIPEYCSKCSVVVLKSNDKLRNKLYEYNENYSSNRLKFIFKNIFEKYNYYKDVFLG